MTPHPHAPAANASRWFKPSVPRPVEGGITTKIPGGPIGHTWWSKQWIRLLESFGIRARLLRGRTYAHKGQVLSIDIARGAVTANVQGSKAKPYTVVIALEALTDLQWDMVVNAMAARAVFAAKLLAGEMPQAILEAFADAHCSLFPLSHSDLITSCSCPDPSSLCKHVAAVYYLLADRFDQDPFLLFSLRGRTKEQIVAALRLLRARSAPLPAADPSAPASAAPRVHTSAPPLEDCLDTFWLTGDGFDEFSALPARPPIHAALLKQLGSFPLKDFIPLDEFSRAYEITSLAALDRAMR